MSYEERMAKIRAERQQFIDGLLAKILALPKVQEAIEEFRADKEWNEKYGWDEYNFEEQALENFFEEGPDEVLAIPEIWEEVREELKDEFESDLSDLKWFLRDGIHFEAEKVLNNKLADLQDEFEDALKRKHNRDKYGKPITK